MGWGATKPSMARQGAVPAKSVGSGAPGGALGPAARGCPPSNWPGRPPASPWTRVGGMRTMGENSGLGGAEIQGARVGAFPISSGRSSVAGLGPACRPAGPGPAGCEPSGESGPGRR